MNHLKPDEKLYGLPFTFDSFQGMPYRKLGRSGLRVSAIGLGTWKMGYPETGDGSRVDEATSYAIFDRAIETGVTFWDTANRYNDSSGNSERVIGKWLKANPDQRRNIVLATKMFGAMDGRTPNHCWLSRVNILDSVYASLERMQTDRIDLLYFHRYDVTTPAEESLEAIEDLVRQDLVRYFAVSNFTVDQLRQYRVWEQGMSARVRVLAVQNKFDILDGESPAYLGMLSYCHENGLSFVPYSPLARGLLTSRYLDQSEVGPGDRVYDEGDLASQLTEKKAVKIKRLAQLAGQWDLELSQLVLAYTLQLPGMGSLIPSASSVAQLESNSKAGKLELEPEQVSQMSSLLKS